MLVQMDVCVCARQMHDKGSPPGEQKEFVQQGYGLRRVVVKHND